MAKNQKIILLEYKISKNFKPLASSCVQLFTLRTDYALYFLASRVRDGIETEINLNVKRMCAL